MQVASTHASAEVFLCQSIQQLSDLLLLSRRIHMCAGQCPAVGHPVSGDGHMQDHI